MADAFGPYLLLKRIAVGGMGEIWLARTKRGGLVVVKRLLQHLKEEQDFVTMFFDEARIAAALDHPNIARILDLGETQGDYYIAMEYVHGLALRDVINVACERDGALAVALSCRIIADAATALDFAHQAKTPAGAPLNLIHRDISPQNILVGFDGVVKVIDFGVAKATNKLTRTATGIIKGKYAYMSPEQARGEALDGRSDIFSLGVVMWESLCSQRLFKRELETATLGAVVNAPIAAPSKHRAVPRGLDAVVLKALERDVDRRYASAGAFARALEQLISKQRLPATRAHVSASLRDLFPDEPDLESINRLGEDESISESVPRPELDLPASSALKTTALDPRELERRIASTRPTDSMHGTFFNALLTAVMRAMGAAAEPKVRRAARAKRTYVDALTYPTTDFLRMLWKAVELLAPTHRSVEEAIEALGHATMDALLASAFGRSLEELAGQECKALWKPLLTTLEPMIQPGQRLVAGVQEQAASLVFKGEVLPMQWYLGLMRSLCEKLYGVTLQARWEKTAADRIEVTLGW